MIRNIILFLSILMVATTITKAQELNCDVTVNALGLQTTDPAVIKTLEDEVRKFMNENVWTDDDFKADERIKCQLAIAITSDAGNNEYNANATMSLSRPVFNANYETELYSDQDDKWNFQYQQFDDLNFNENTYNSELTSLLAFYAYVFIGTYYDSFALEGGTPYFVKAQTVVNNAQQNSTSKSWDAFGGQVTRYRYIENILNNRFKGMRNAYYQYHRNGLDKMYDDPEAGTQAIIQSLSDLELVYKSSSNTMIMETFFRSKKDEMIDIFQNASNAQKPQILQKLSAIRPSEIAEFQQIMKRAQ